MQQPDRYSPQWMYAATAAVYLVMFAYTLLRWDSIPDPVAMHMGPGGEVDSAAPKTLLSAMAVLWIGAAISIGVALIVPSTRLARATRETDRTTTQTIPFSETAAARAELLIGKTQHFIAELLVATALIMALVQLVMVFPDPALPFGVFVAATIAYCAWAIWRSITLTRQAKQDIENLKPDAQELRRVETLRMKAGAGMYSEPADPMAVTVLPSEPGKLQFNTAHPAGKRLLTRIGIGVALTIAAPLIIGFSI